MCVWRKRMNGDRDLRLSGMKRDESAPTSRIRYYDNNNSICILCLISSFYSVSVVAWIRIDWFGKEDENACLIHAQSYRLAGFVSSLSRLRKCDDIDNFVFKGRLRELLLTFGVWWLNICRWNERFVNLSCLYCYIE